MDYGTASIKSTAQLCFVESRERSHVDATTITPAWLEAAEPMAEAFDVSGALDVPAIQNEPK
jgi:hypothetical protein